MRKNYIVTVKLYDQELQKYICREYWADGFSEEQIAQQFASYNIIGIEEIDRDTREDYDCEE